MALSIRNAAVSIGNRANISLLANGSSFLRSHLLGLASSSTTPCRSILSPSHFKSHRYALCAAYGTEGQKILDPVAPKVGNYEKPSQNWEVKMLYDGDCPLCMREVNMLKERNKTYGTIKFVDISSEEYCPEQNRGLDYKTAMGRIHAILSDGTVVTDVEAFRRLYEAVGLGWVYAITKYEPIASIANAVYGVWAKYRLQITGRPPLEEVLEARKNKKEVCNDSKTCKT